MNKEALMEMLKNRLGDEIDLSGITDEDINSLLLPPDEEEEVEDDEQIIDNEAEQDEVEDDKAEEDEDLDFNLEELNEADMTPTEKALYRALKEQKENNRRERLNSFISSSGVDDTTKSMLKEMVSLGADKEKIEQLITKITEDNNKNKRRTTSDRTFSKKQIKGNTKSTKPKVKIGSKEWGASL